MTSTNSNKFCYTLDVLTDGSEHTGSGTLFLSVWKIPLSIRKAYTSSVANNNNATNNDSDDDVTDDDDDEDVTDDEMTSSSNGSVCSSSSSNNGDDDDDDDDDDEEEEEEEEDDPYAWLTGTSLDDNNNDGPVARYALSGVGDATARLCADQRYKLAPIRACFLPDLLSSNVDGLSALFLALHGSGSPSLHMVVPASFENNNQNHQAGGSGSGSGGSSFIEELATITLGSYKKFDIRTCEVREEPTTCNSYDTNKNTSLAWWRVYEDDYLIVHACSSKTLLSSTTTIGQSTTSASRSSLLYLYSFSASSQSQSTTLYCTLALLPPKCRDATNVVERLMEKNLPLIRDDVPIKSIDYVIVLDPYCSSSLSSTSSSMGTCLVTLPRKNQQEKEKGKQHMVDEGILIRSQQLAQRFHSHMPWAFVNKQQQQNTRTSSSSSPSTSTTTCNSSSYKNKSIICSDKNNEIILKSGTSIILETKNNDYKSRRRRKTKTVRVWDRRNIIWNKDIKEEWTNRTLDSLQSFIKQSSPLLSSTTIATTDENEIDIDDDDDDDDENDANDANEDEDEKDRIPSETMDQNEIDIDIDDDDDDDDDDDENDTEEEKKYSGPLSMRNKDETKIDIDIKDEANRINVASGGDGPRLIVLGTGCATPSAYRGASAYALVLPVDDTKEKPPGEYGQHHNNHGGGQIYLLDCGEGTSTMLSRNYGHINDWAQRIHGIWISHAHLDHYGGLPTILRLLHEYRESKNKNSKSGILESTPEEPFPKRPKYSLSGRRRGDGDNNIVPWVIAPPKVLRYLDIVLNCRHGRSKGVNGMNGNIRQYFEPRVHQDPTFPTGPWIHFENIKVNHGCPAFGLLIGWRIPMATTGRSDCRDGSATRDEKRTSSQFLCYSGDTRPSHGLVQACRRALQRNDNNYTSNTYGRNNNNYRDNPHPRGEDSRKKLFLIHEATYQETETNMALKKKHSTINEAFQVACDIPASRVLMTHFSQRYDNNVSITAVTNSTDTNATENRTNENNDSFVPSLGLAVDGLHIIL